MGDVFVSYASSDRERARLIAQHLTRQGWTVWWDRSIPPGRTFDEVIEEAIDSAQCMVVLWSNDSVASQWVKTEAAEGARRRVLVPALIDDVKIPLEFRRIQAANLVGWQGTLPHPEFDLLVAAIATVLGRRPDSVADPTAGATPAVALPESPPVAAPPKQVVVQFRRPVMIPVGRLTQSLLLAVRSGTPEERMARHRAAIAAAVGAAAGGVFFGAIYGAWRGRWGWVLLPTLLAALTTYAWVLGAQRQPPRAARNGIIAGLIAGAILTAVMAAVLNPGTQMSRWVAVESLAWGVYGLFGGVVIERGWRLRVGPPILTGLGVAVVTVLVLVEVIYREFSAFRLMTGAGWMIAMTLFPLPELHRDGRPRAGSGVAADRISSP